GPDPASQRSAAEGSLVGAVPDEPTSGHRRLHGEELRSLPAGDGCQIVGCCREGGVAEARGAHWQPLEQSVSRACQGAQADASIDRGSVCDASGPGAEDGEG